MKQPQPSNDMSRIVDLSGNPSEVPSAPVGADPFEPVAARRGVTAVLDSMVRNTEARERSFEKALHDQMARQPVPASVAVPTPQAAPEPAAAMPPTVTVAAAPMPPAPPASVEPVPPITPPAQTAPAVDPASVVAARPAPVAPAAPTLPGPRVDLSMADFATLGRPAWNQSRLEQIGMPGELLERTAQLDPHADIKWVEALVRAATAACTTVLEGSMLIVSRASTGLAEALGLSVHRPGDLPPYGGSIFCLVEDLDASREWLDRIIGDRVVHAVLTDAESEGLLGLNPAAVSYASEMGAARALRTALANEIPLMFGTTHDGRPIRVTPFDVALAIRSWMRS